VRLPSTGARLWALRGLLLLGSVMASIVLAECSLRLTPEVSWHEQIEKQVAHGQVPSVYIGDRRFKLRTKLTPIVDFESGAYRILFLGDSFTYGSGLAAAETAFPARVTKQLQEFDANVLGRRFEYFNGGIPGSLTGRWVQLLRLTEEGFDPHLVVTVFSLRDGTRGLGYRGKLREYRETMARLQRDSFIFSHSRLFRELVQKKMRGRVSRDYLAEMEEAYLGDSRSTAEWQKAQSNLLLLRDIARAQGSDFVLIVFPVLYGLQGDYPLAGVTAEIERFARSNGITVFSLFPAFQGKNEEALWVSATDQHPNERAHGIAAQAIAEFLSSRVEDR